MSRSIHSALAVCALVLAPAFAQDAAPPPAPESNAKQGEPAAPVRPTVVAVDVEGHRRYTAKQLADALGQKVGSALDPNAISRGLKTLWQVFHVRVDHVQYREVEGGLRLLLSVTELPVDLEPRFIGNSEIDTETLRKWALLGDKSELYLYQSARVKQRLVEGYRREGFYFADVEVRVREPGATPATENVLPDVIFEIREGPQVRVKDVIIKGNHSMPDTGMLFWAGGLTKLANTDLDGPWLFNWKGSKFVEDELQADLLAMRQVYRDRGFLDAVVELESLDFHSDRSGVEIYIVIDEGRPYTVSKLAIRAVTLEVDPKSKERVDKPAELLFPESELLELCKSKVGERFESNRQLGDLAELKRYYGERGYLAHPSLAGHDPWEFLDPELVFDDEKHTVAVTYKIAQGRKRFIREVMFRGAKHTRDRVVRREIGVLPGEMADSKEISKSLSRLYSTNYFLDEMTPEDHKDPTYQFIPTEDPDWVDLEYLVEEGRVVNFMIQAAVDSNSGLFGRLSLSMRNFDATNTPDHWPEVFGDIYDKEAFHGAGQLLNFEISPGTEIDYYRVRFVEPDLFGTQFNRYGLELEFLRRTSTSADFYTEERTDRRIEIGREFGRELWAGIGYTNQILDITDIEAPLTGIVDPLGTTVPAGIFEQEGESSLIGAIFDVRYRNVDTTLNTREGVTVSWKNGVYGGPLGGDYQYYKSDIDFDWIIPLGPPDQDAPPGFRLSAGLGFSDAFGDSTDVPYTERFFLGGRTTLRGFEYRGVGPNFNGEPIGGETSINATAQLHYPLYSVVQPGSYRSVEMFYAVLFADAGVLDPDPYQLDFDELRASVGFGFGMARPLPLILNFGFPIREGDGDSTEVLSFSISYMSF